MRIWQSFHSFGILVAFLLPTIPTIALVILMNAKKNENLRFLWKNNSHRHSTSQKWMLPEVRFSNQIGLVRPAPFTFRFAAAKNSACLIPPPSGKISIRRANCF